MHSNFTEINLLENSINDKGLITKLKNQLERKNIFLTFGAEIECYFTPELKLDIINQKSKQKFIKERGVNQYEYHIHHSEKIEDFIKNIKNSINNNKEKFQENVMFNPKPFKNDYGNALQIQFTSTSKLFQDNIDKICFVLCFYTNSIFQVIAPTKADYARFSEKFMAPTHISYGLNNRSCVYRITGNQDLKRIELRAPSINSNLTLTLAFIYICTNIALKNSTDYNLSNKEFYDPNLTYRNRIYGNASDAQYNLPALPQCLKKSQELFNKNFWADFF